MGLFDKKYCDVCGEKIRFLGNRKLEDGNLCKSCAEKLSPWFSERRRSTVADIKAQLADREANRARAASFAVSRTLGEGTKLYLDEKNGRFAVLRAGETMADNPDVLDMKQVTGCEVKVEQSKHEEKTKDEAGKPVSYDPPRYRYSYQFYLIIHVDHPWFDEMRFRVNRQNVEIETGLPIKMPGILSAAKIYTPDVPNTDACEDYQRYLAMAEDMRRALLGIQDEAEAAPVPEDVPSQAPACPYCGERATPDERGCCPCCGAKI